MDRATNTVLTACAAAVSAYPKEMGFRYQFARGLQMRDKKTAFAIFQGLAARTPIKGGVWTDLALTLVPLALGSGVYLLYRPETIVAFKLVDASGLREIVHGMRLWFQSVLPIGGGPLLYSVPQALWAFSFIYTLCWIWRPISVRPLGMSIVLSAMITIQGGELGQIWFVPGTFDLSDLIYNSAGIACAVGAACARDN